MSYQFICRLIILTGATSPLWSCKSMPELSPEQSYSFKKVANETYEVSLTPQVNNDNTTTYSITTCHKVHQTCVNTFRTSPTKNHPHGAKSFFEMSRLNTARDFIDKHKQRHEADVASHKEVATQLDSEFKELVEGVKTQIIDAIEAAYSPERIAQLPRQELEEYVDREALVQATKINAALERVQSPHIKRAAYIAGFAIKIIPSIPSLLVLKGENPGHILGRILSVVLFIEGSWLLLKGFKTSNDNNLNEIYAEAATEKRVAVIDEALDVRLEEEKNSPAFRDRMAALTLQQETHAAELDELNQAYEREQERYSLLYTYLHYLPQQATKTLNTPDVPNSMMLFLNQLGDLLDNVVRAQLEAEQKTAVLNQFKNQPIIAKFCLPGPKTKIPEKPGKYKIQLSCAKIKKQSL